MKIHTDKLTTTDLYRAMHEVHLSGKVENVYLDDAVEHGSRSKARRFDVHLSADRRKGRNHSTNSGIGGAQNVGRGFWREQLGDVAASYDDWGHWIAALYHLDPDAVIGPYRGSDDFHRATDGAYELDLADLS